jgi:hypothetical protein
MANIQHSDMVIQVTAQVLVIQVTVVTVVDIQVKVMEDIMDTQVTVNNIAILSLQRENQLTSSHLPHLEMFLVFKIMRDMNLKKHQLINFNHLLPHLLTLRKCL